LKISTININGSIETSFKIELENESDEEVVLVIFANTKVNDSEG